MFQKYIAFFCLLLLFSVSNKTTAQYGFSHEIGVIAGPVAFQSDYGERHDLSTNAGNTGFGIGLVHFLNFAIDQRGYLNNTNYFNDHFKLRSELSYSKTELDHLGQWVEGKPSLGKEQLKAMSSSTAVTNIGMQLEFFPLSIGDFTDNFVSWGPFVSFGAQYSFYNATVNSTMGTLGTPSTTFQKYLTPTDDRPYGFSTEKGSVWSVVSSVGTRYKLAPLTDLMVDLRWQYYFSDWVDGLKPNPDLYKENKATDWLVWFNVGCVFYIQ